MTDLTKAHRATLDAVCDTLLPEVRDTPEPLRAGARERGIPDVIAAAVPGLPPHAAGALTELLDGLDSESFADLDFDWRTALLRQAADDNRFALKQLKAMVFGLLLGPVDGTGRNPVWEAIGFPGPVSAPPSPAQAPKSLPLVPVGSGPMTLTADVCVVGSGAGGSVIAARMAQAGRSVIVLEAGPYRNEADFDQLESTGARMYLGGGGLWSEQGEIGLLAGSTLGGGTVINSMVCLRTPMDVRREWASAGLDGLDGPDFDAHLDRVWGRLGVNTEATRFNVNTEHMIKGLTACGYAHERLPRNASPDDDPKLCGYCNAGCQQGHKRSTLSTYLEDAAAAGARFLTDCHVDRILVEHGRAAGVEGVAAGRVPLVVRAPTIVVAAGGIESPALLLRSGIGGPATGRHLRLHPAWMVTGVYDEPIEAWHGQIQAAVSFDLTHCESGVGFLVETLGLSPAVWAANTPFTDGIRHRDELLKLRHMASWHGVCHDHGTGRVVLDRAGRALVRWRLDDDIDRRVALRAHLEIARMHRAAGAREVFPFHWNGPRWREGEDFEAFLDALRAVPPDEYTGFSAHQMSSCRMGADPSRSVADGRGELHDVPGVWIGDASALPGAPGVNPMITIMALAERTAERMTAAEPK
ncbi:GMC family oxidoreductase [Actinomadura vinacea]|uniref:long-chain-alcohol oxidase n=1 Tax=Actinomadura vinacea TaxID=115336 RepID=A0ABP5VCH1_9ACTN